MIVGRFFVLLFGVVFVLAGVGMLIGGGAITWSHVALRDSEGFYSTKTNQLESDAHAIVSEPANIDLGAAWFWPWGNLATIKVEGSSADPSQETFIGVAEARDLDTYLTDVRYDEMQDPNINRTRTLTWNYREHRGDSVPGVPSEETFWIESAYGPGSQSIEWDLESGSYSLVLMNNDGSAGLDIGTIVSIRVPSLFGVSIGLLAGGLLVSILGSVMVSHSVRRRSRA